MQPLVGLIMGSVSDWETLQHTAQTLERLGVPHEVRVLSAHRTPDLLFEYAASAQTCGIEVIIAGAGGAAHLPGMAAAKTVLPVLGVPVQSQALNGLDSLLSLGTDAGRRAGGHAYGKQARPGRKLGHATLRADNVQNLEVRLDQLFALIEPKAAASIDSGCRGEERGTPEQGSCIVDALADVIEEDGSIHQRSGNRRWQRYLPSGAAP